MGVRFEYFRDGFGLFVTDMTFSMVGGEDGSHDVGFVGKIVAGFPNPGGRVDLEGKSEFHPSNTEVAGCYAFSHFLSVV